MTTLCKWCITLVVCALIAISGVAQTVAITSSQEFNSRHRMDETWQSIAKAAGYAAEIHPTSFLSISNLRSETDLLIISSGTGTIDNIQKSNILQFVNSGGHIYIQSEYLVTFDGNQLFKYLLEKTGSAFEWGGQVENNIGPMNIFNGFENGLNDHQLDYFWYGTYGCGDAQVIPFLEVGGKNYAFYYRSANPTIGNIITNADHDWIRRIDDNRAARAALMTNMLEVLLNGLPNQDNNEFPTLTLQENINFCTDQNISVQVNNANVQDIQWHQNGIPTTTGSVIDMSVLSSGDSLYAQVKIPTGCLESVICTETIIVLKEHYNHSMNTSFSELGPICPGSLARIDLTYDKTLPNIRHNWFLNGQDTPINTDYYSSDNFKDGDIIQHALTYYNGCEDIVLPTIGSVTVAWNDVSVPDFYINGQTKFCSSSTATLSLDIPNIDSTKIKWYVDNIMTDNGEISIAVEATQEIKEVFATIKCYNECSGWVTISTPAVSIGIQNLEITFARKADHDCEHGEGFIDISSSSSNTTYEWSNGQSGNFISNLSKGTYTVTATSEAGCIKTESYEINKIVFPLVDSIAIKQPNCNDGNGKVQLNLSNNDLGYINVKWVDDQGHVISTEKESSNLPAGNYKVHVDANGNCEEVYDVIIDSYHEHHDVIADTIFVEKGEMITLRPDLYGYEGHSIEWQFHPGLSCLDCINAEMTSAINHLFNYVLISDEGCRIPKAILVIVIIRDPYYAPSAFSPNNDGINDYYKIQPRSDVFPTSSLMIFDRWGSLIHEEASDTRGWDGKSYGKIIQKGIYVYVQNFEDTSGQTYLAKGSITIFN